MSKTLAQLKADVLTIVKRADLVDAIDLHTKNAILKAHSADYWMQDLFEFAFSFGTAAPTYSLEIRALIPLFRKMKYLNTIDQTSLDVIKALNGISPTNFLDAYGYKRDYSFYEAGVYIQIRCSDSPQYFNAGVYLLPDTTLAVPSWIADSYPYAIVYEAARTLFKSIGFDEQSAAMEKLVAEAMQMVREAGVPTIGE